MLHNPVASNAEFRSVRRVKPAKHRDPGPLTLACRLRRGRPGWRASESPEQPRGMAVRRSARRFKLSDGCVAARQRPLRQRWRRTFPKIFSRFQSPDPNISSVTWDLNRSVSPLFKGSLTIGPRSCYELPRLRTGEARGLGATLFPRHD